MGLGGQALESVFKKDFGGHDRHKYPEGIFRVTGGHGGEGLLIAGREKTVLYDGGMACFKDNVIRNIYEVLDFLGRREKGLDYVILSHTHYDHLGVLPYIIEEWPDVKVCAAEKAVNVFKSSGAKRTMKELGQSAAKQYGYEGFDVKVDGMRVDVILHDGDRLMLAEDEWIECYLTKGHTDCSMTYLLMPSKIMLACESTGVLDGPDKMHTAVLKDFDETIRMAQVLREMDYDYLISPHFGIVPEWFNKEYFSLYIKTAKEERKLLMSGLERGLSEEQIADEHKVKYWSAERAKEHPYAAYRLNTEIMIRNFIKENER